MARDPSELRDLAGAARTDAKALARHSSSGARRATALKGHLGVAERVAWSEPLPLDDVKASAMLTARPSTTFSSPR